MYVQSIHLLQFIPTYKINQDHLELFFGSIRSLGGHNDNPSCLYFRSAYKKLLIRAEIREGGLGNCIPLQQLNILNIDLAPKRAIELINESNPIYHENEIELDDMDLDDHNYTLLCGSNNLSNFTEEVVIYCWIYCKKKLGSSVKCERCVEHCMGPK